MPIKYSNNAKTTVVSLSGTTVTVADVSNFPAFSIGADYTYVTLLNGTDVGVFKVVSINHSNSQIELLEAPDPALFPNNSTRIELRITAELISGVANEHKIIQGGGAGSFYTSAAASQTFFLSDGASGYTDTTTTFYVPSGVASLSAIAVGGGGGSASGYSGGRGGVAYRSKILVYPDEPLTVTVGAAGPGRSNVWEHDRTGGTSSIARADGTIIVSASGGSNSLGRGTPQDLGIPSEGVDGLDYYTDLDPDHTNIKEGEAGVNMLTLVSAYGRTWNSNAIIYNFGDVLDPNGEYAVGSGGAKYYSPLGANSLEMAGQPGGIRLIWGYTDSTNTTLRAFPNDGIGNY